MNRLRYTVEVSFEVSDDTSMTQIQKAANQWADMMGTNGIGSVKRIDIAEQFLGRLKHDYHNGNT